MIDLDYSFLRLRDNLKDAKNLNESPAINFEYVGQVHLTPGETYLQITNSPTPIDLGTFDVFLVDDCGEEVIEITNNVFITRFTDTNGINQITWEFINAFDYNNKALSIRFRELNNGDEWFTNLFITTVQESELTIRFDYKNNCYHYGTQYNRADFYQSIRLKGYYKNKINESERSEYHQISTDVTVSTRNIRKFKNRYLLNAYDDWTICRLENLLTNNEVYQAGARMYSTTPIEFVEGVELSNISQHEMILNPDYTQLFTFEYQIFEGLQFLTKSPIGANTLAGLPTDITGTFNYPVELGTGVLTVHDASDNSVLATYTESDITITDNTFTIDNTGVITSNGSYYIMFSNGLFSYISIDFEGINNITGWNFTVQDGMFDSSQFNNTEFLTN